MNKSHVTKHRDITGDIGPLFGVVSGDTPKIPMYSYERPAYILWQGVFNGLREAGYSEKQAIDWLQSKSPRWALDCELGEKLREIGFEFGKLAAKQD